MSKTPASSHRDTSALARCYAEVNQWQLARGMALIDHATPLPGEQVLDDGAKLAILVEKDFACLAPREGEDESDMFPHPDAGSSAC